MRPCRSTSAITAGNPQAITSNATAPTSYSAFPMRSATPAADAAVTFLAFLAFGAVPLAPYFLLPATDPATFPLSVGATLAALIALGLFRWIATGERVTRCVGETVLVGGICAAVAFGVGAIVGG